MEGIRMEALDQDLAETIKVWPVVSKVLSTLHTEEQYGRISSQVTLCRLYDRFKMARV